MIGKSIIKLWSLSVLRCSFYFFVLHFYFANSSLLMLYSVDCSKCSFLRDTVIFLEFWYSVLEIAAKITIPILPKFTVNDSSFLLMLLGISIYNSWNKSLFNIMFKIIEKCVRYYKVWQEFITRPVMYYKVWQTVITKGVRYYKVWQAVITKCIRYLQSVTVIT